MSDGVFTPLFRRFADEKNIELSETKALYERLKAQNASVSLETEARRIFQYLRLPAHLREPFWRAICRVLQKESAIFDFPDLALLLDRLTMKEQMEFRRFLRAKEVFLGNRERTLTVLHQALWRIFIAQEEILPQSEQPSPFTIPLIYTVPEPRIHLQQLYNTMADDEYRNLGLFTAILVQIYENICAENGVQPFTEHRRPLKAVADSDTPLDETVATYFAGTPFRDFYLMPVPLKFTAEDRFSHMHIVGGTGAGKTSLLETLILNDLKSDEQPGLVIVDSQGDLIPRILSLDLPGLHDRLVLITPKDVEYPPALNIFDVNRDRLAGYGQVVKEQVIAGVIQTFDYLFTGLLGADLTAKQGVFFRYVARLMLSLPETMGRPATILDMMALMEDATPYAKAIESLPPIQKAFFERDFQSKTFVQTKEQIRYRLQAIVENPTIARLFTSRATRIDLFEELNRGSIILVDTAKDFLKSSSSHFGRIFISLVLQAALERAAIPEPHRRPAFLMVDEAAAYFDSNIDDLLTEARKYRLGCVFAHQYLDQASSSLRASLAANTAIKFASGLSTADARAMASDMRTTPDFILNQPKLQFAAHIRGVTPNAVSIPVRPGLMGRERQVSEGDLDWFIERNRMRVVLPLELSISKDEMQEDGCTISPMSDEDISDEW